MSYKKGRRAPVFPFYRFFAIRYTESIPNIHRTIVQYTTGYHHPASALSGGGLLSAALLPHLRIIRAPDTTDRRKGRHCFSYKGGKTHYASNPAGGYL